MNKRHYEHTLPNIRGSLSNTYGRRNFITTAAIKYEKNRIKMVRLGKEST